MKKGFFAGLILFGISAWPLFLMGREVLLIRSTNNQYKFKRVHKREDVIGTTRVELRDKVPNSESQSQEVKAPIQIKVGEKDYSSDAVAGIRPNHPDAGRYHGYVNLIRVHETEPNTSWLVVIQNLGTNGKTPYEENVRWRALWVSDDGAVREDIFRYGDRCDPPVRFRLANWATPRHMGCKSDLMNVWPGLFYPILFPLISGALGGLLVLIFGSLMIVRRGSESASA